jgi:hypothetical protein
MKNGGFSIKHADCSMKQIGVEAAFSVGKTLFCDPKCISATSTTVAKVKTVFGTRKGLTCPG